MKTIMNYNDSKSNTKRTYTTPEIMMVELRDSLLDDWSGDKSQDGQGGDNYEGGDELEGTR